MAGKSAQDWVRQFQPYLIPVPAYTAAVTEGLQWFLQFGDGWAPYILGALKILARPETWSGTDTDIATAVREAMTLQAQILERPPGLPLGSIIAYATTDPPTGTLACDGSTHLRVDFPALYAVLASAFITDADHFTVPDLRGRTVLGAGSGSGLTTRVMDGSGGEESHTLNEAEMPAHYHSEYGGIANSPWGRAVPNYLTGAGGGTHTYNVLQVSSRNDNGIIDALTTDIHGSGSSHNNMQPWRALGYAIIAE